MLVDVHREVPGLLAGPVRRRVRRAGGNPDPPGADVDEDQEIEVDQPLGRPLLFAREVALPERVGMPRHELVSGVRVGVRIGTQPRGQQDVLHRLPRNAVPEPFYGLANFGVSPSRLSSDPDN